MIWRILLATLIGVMVLGTILGLILARFLDGDTPDQRSPPPGSGTHGSRG